MKTKEAHLKNAGITTLHPLVDERIGKAMESYANQKVQEERETIADKAFTLANQCAVDGCGDVAVKLHRLHNDLIKDKP